MLRRIFVPNLEIVTWIGGESWHGQAQNRINFDFEVNVNHPPPKKEKQNKTTNKQTNKTIGILTKVLYTYSPNLVILAWTGDELSRGQASAYRTHRQYPKAKTGLGKTWLYESICCQWQADSNRDRIWTHLSLPSDVINEHFMDSHTCTCG